ncbi:class I SAM-dependent methyltransferase [Legionella oakridgensis]|nr:class I SAM-dependent methyltransferase [Legionella oakridgensis]ETO92910.1 methylase involved in ubiquinone/menaquinone biosynthesis [Legionella oakridgensis RV-2-2007]KTD37116.1 Methyltransferase domain protein [Legionella oakridgensis]STY20571.1 biotin biosynthesis protein BioC [Legionella longbeachae]
MEYIKHFNRQTENYLSYRPDYPESFFDFLATLARANAYVWDCGTGNGQAAFSLSKRFDLIVATDINFSPLTIAPRCDNLNYICCASEKTPLLESSIDLITVAQALHWFNFDNFYAEVRRVAKPSAVFAAWCYSLGRMNEKIDAIIGKLYLDILGERYWPKERRYIDEHYQSIPFPFQRIMTPAFVIEKNLDLYALLGYLNTWSAVKEYQKYNHENPIELIINDLQAVWGDPKEQRIMRWPLHVLAGLIH